VVVFEVTHVLNGCLILYRRDAGSSILRVLNWLIMVVIQGLKGEFNASIRGRSLVKQILKLFYVNNCANILDNMG